MIPCPCLGVFWYCFRCGGYRKPAPIPSTP